MTTNDGLTQGNHIDEITTVSTATIPRTDVVGTALHDDGCDAIITANHSTIRPTEVTLTNDTGADEAVSLRIDDAGAQNLAAIMTSGNGVGDYAKAENIGNVGVDGTEREAIVKMTGHPEEADTQNISAFATPAPAGTFAAGTAGALTLAA